MVEYPLGGHFGDSCQNEKFAHPSQWQFYNQALIPLTHSHT